MDRKYCPFFRKRDDQFIKASNLLLSFLSFVSPFCTFSPIQNMAKTPKKSNGQKVWETTQNPFKNKN
ncbi:hypothetical protein QJS04_geneDACA017755 [Acorus gramineus]|uniref:Uncharacterized protein n=1 Tax=Acorus gramineus TaxID=55184 RepID=A0AAV9A009_ACOGR|nr:hypothetical protein QJS04_geneDACA017755 [Acorus gramineus]